MERRKKAVLPGAQGDDPEGVIDSVMSKALNDEDIQDYELDASTIGLPHITKPDPEIVDSDNDEYNKANPKKAPVAKPKPGLEDGIAD